LTKTSKPLPPEWRTLNNCRRTKAPNDLLGDLASRRRRFDCQSVFAWIRFLKRIDLTAQQRSRHEMVSPPCNMLLD
jgi:hypothetical protein